MSRSRCRFPAALTNGFTLIELMITVAIVGILATTAVYMFTRQTAKAKAAEVRAVFGEIQVRQEAYRLENSRYTCLTSVAGDDTAAECSDADLFPDAAPTNRPRTFAEVGTDWERLKMRIDKTQLLCVYSSVSGNQNDGTNIGGGSLATTLFTFGAGDVPEADPWYYMVAQCNLDGDSGTDSFFFGRSDTPGVDTVNPGK